MWLTLSITARMRRARFWRVAQRRFVTDFDEADLVIAKGQGNYETLSDVDKDVFFILRAKCPVIAQHLDCEIGQMIFRRSDAFNDIVDLVKEAE